MTSSVAVFGCGAVGLTIAGFLADAGKQPILVARGKRLLRLKEWGFNLHFNGSVKKISPCDLKFATPSQRDPQGPPQFLLLCLKSHQNQAALEDLMGWVGPHTTVIAMQNGIPYWYCEGQDAGLAKGCVLNSLSQQVLQNFLPLGRAHVGSVIYLGASEGESPDPECPMEVLCGSIKSIVLGATDTTMSNKNAAAQAVSFLSDAGVPAVNLSFSIRRDVWHKLLGNGSLNPISALTLQPLGYLSTTPHSLELIRNSMLELIQVAVKLDIFKEGEIDVDERIRLSRTLPKEFKTSMLQDIEAGRPPEIESILGAVLDLAAIVNVHVPVLAVLHSLVCARADALMETGK